MNRRNVFILFLLCSITHIGLSQSDEKDGTYDLLYGTRLFNNNFNYQVNTFNSFHLTSPVQLIGVAISGGFIVNRGVYRYEGHLLSYCKIIPQYISVNDTLRSKITGFVYSMSLFGWDLIENSNRTHILLSGGFDVGRIRLKEHKTLDYSNPFLAPKISIQPKITVGNISLSLRADYSWDISKGSWKNKLQDDLNTFSPASFKSSGLTVLFSIGYLAEAIHKY